MDGRPTWTDCDEAGDYVVPNVLSPRDLVFRPDNMNETVPHTFSRNAYMSRVMRKSVFFSICENKDAHQLRSYCAADQRLCFRYMDSILPPATSKIRNFKPLDIFCDCRARFVSNLVGNPEVRFSRDAAHMTNVM